MIDKGNSTVFRYQKQQYRVAGMTLEAVRALLRAEGHEAFQIWIEGGIKDGEIEKVVHKFEAAGLGTAPFRVVGFREEKYVACPGAPVQPGGTCDYCGNAIMNVFVVQGSDGRKFNVGCDCVLKTGDEGLKRELKTTPEYRAMMRDRARAKAVCVKAELAGLVAKHAEAFKVQPHPQGFVDFKTGAPLTRLDSEQWLLDHAGAAGNARQLRRLKAEGLA